MARRGRLHGEALIMQPCATALVMWMSWDLLAHAVSDTVRISRASRDKWAIK